MNLLGTFVRLRLLGVIAFALVVPSAAPSSSARDAAFSSSDMLSSQQNCTIADTEFWANRPIDNSSCGEDGEGDEVHRAQNRAKNEMCAGDFLTSSPGTPARVTQFTFRRLQEEATDLRTQLGLGVRSVPPDRTPFRNTVHTTSFGDALGEGELVRYVGFLLEGHFTGKEGVNCDRATQLNFDIHMAFVEQRPPASPTTAQAEALECSSVTAEIIPRLRPDAWNLMGRLGKKTGGLKGAQTRIASHDLNRPLRLTGHLFFDGSHEACRNGKRVGGQPARVSNWEIHPVYAIDVCRQNSMTSCRWDNESVWQPLHEKLSEDDEVEQ